ncbi:MAG: exo-alpha-sialidase [Deltaproteobacteria bacterium]|nr:exo-alpha-sialidase [Deltaproteobacteria bacterium]
MDRRDFLKTAGVAGGMATGLSTLLSCLRKPRADAHRSRGRKASAFCEKQELFEARTAGYHVYRIPGLLTTKRGTVIAHCEARKGVTDWEPIDICMRRSTDGGVTWGEPYVVLDHTRFDPDKPVHSFSCFADRVTGDVHVLFCNDYAHVYYMKSEDDGATFSEPRDVTPTFDAFKQVVPWRVVAVGPGHSIQLENGRLVGAVWMSDGTDDEVAPGKIGHRPSEVAAVYSDDHGETWLAGDFVVRNEERFRNPNETCLVQLSDGQVLFNTRTESHAHRRLISRSPNGADGWTQPEFDDALVEPICFGSIIGWDAVEGRRIVFANPGVLERTMQGGPGSWGIGPEERGKFFDRKNLTVRLSTDDCQTWSASRLLEDGPSGYSDLTVLRDGTLLCLYECGIVKHMMDDRYLRLARFNAEWIRQEV